MKEFISSLNNDSLAREIGHVYQVWEDGEITLQKSGDLLWMRNLHSMEPGYPGSAIPVEDFPHQSGERGYVFVTEEKAYTIRKAILGE